MPASPVAAETVRDGATTGLKTAFGTLLINPSSGQWTLKDKGGKVLIARTNFGQRDVTTDPANPSLDVTVGNEGEAN